tara:strand:+ start:7923 stop:9725 length:1803 start_codon:yes stop_codon:yes gene_type:complete
MFLQKSLPIIFLALLFSCSNSPKKNIDTVFEKYYQERLQFNPIESTLAGDLVYNDTLPNLITDEYEDKLLAFYQKYEAELTPYKPDDLTSAQKISRDVLLWDLNIKIEGLQNDLQIVTSPLFGLPIMDLLPLNQIFSLHLFIAQLGNGSSAQPFNTVQDYENWLHRVEDFQDFLNSSITNMKSGMEIGVVHPKIIIERMIGQLDDFVKTPAKDHVFYKPATQFPESFSDEEIEQLSEAYQEMVTEDLIPTFKKLQDFLQDEYLPEGVETSGIGALPYGKKTYEYFVRVHTSTTMTPDEIHQLGLSEVNRIESEMEKVKEEVGFKGDLKAFFNHVRTSKEQMPYTKPEQVITHFENIHERMKPQLAELFDETPKAGFVVRRTEAFREASASAEYNSGSKDGSRPGVFYVPIPNVTAYNKFSDESLFLHEAIPGHHYQLSLQQENESLPSFMHTEGLGVFVEGWALYSESLGKELGLYTDPYQYFGMLSAEMHRAIRLVVDTGIHSKGWTREEAIQYSLDHEAESEASITSEIERYMVGPGQALSYKIGQLKILELRDRAKEALGDEFDIKEFHNQVLNSGSLPLEVLERKIDAWIESELNN